MSEVDKNELKKEHLSSILKASNFYKYINNGYIRRNKNDIKRGERNK